MPEARVAARRGEARHDGSAGAASVPRRPIAGEQVVGERRTVTIRGQVADQHMPRPGQGPARRRPPRSVHERAGSRPDRIAMWAVLLGVVLVLAAATSSHAAVPGRLSAPATSHSAPDRAQLPSRA